MARLIGIPVFLALLATAPYSKAQAPPVSFVARIDSPLPASGGSTCVAAADFNGDGKMDVVACGNANNLWVLLGNGDGTFQPATTSVVGTTNPLSVRLGDFNGDGKTDLLSVNQDSTVSVLLGNGNGTFQAQVVTTLTTNKLGVLGVGDFNGDGKADLAIPIAVPQQGESALAILLGNGDGTFKSPIASNFSTQSPSSIEIADFNKDGKPDVVWSGTEISVFLGNGDGTIRQTTNTNAGITGPLAVADFNGDGIPDVAVNGEPSSTSVVVLLGNGDGTFRVLAPVFGGVNTSTALFAGDFNGDGKADLLLGGNVDGNAVLLGNGDGTFQKPVATANPVGGEAVGDFNGDGVLDVVISGPGVAPPSGNSASVVSVALGRGDGSFLVDTSLFWSCNCNGAGGGSSILATDLNADGKPDLLFVQAFQYYASMGVDFLGKGNGAFETPIVFGVVGQPSPPSAVLADFNHDGKLDLAMLSGFVQVFFGVGDGTFQFQAAYGNANAQYVAAADMNGDGNVDLVTADGNSISVMLGKGDGTFGFPTSFTVSARSLVIADFNHDGKLDVATAAGTSVAVLLGNGDGTFGVPVNYGQAGTNVAVGDFNHDGNLDLVASDSSSNTVSVLLGNGDGTFRAPVNLNVGAAPSLLAVADFNGDGNPDIAVLTPGWGDVTILRGNGDGTFQPAQYFGFFAGSNGMAATDLNGDGATDLAIAGPTGPILLFNRPTRANGIPVPNSVSFGYQFVQTQSSSQSVTLNNFGRSNLTVNSVQIAGAQASDFHQTNTCGSGIDSGSACTFSITFTPQGAGSRNATLTITDNGLASPQTVALSGTGFSFGLGIASGGSNLATVPAGQTANYTVTIGGTGYSGTVTLSCTGAPTEAACSIPGSVNLVASKPSTITVSVTTTAPTAAGKNPAPLESLPWLWASTVCGFVILPSLRERTHGWRSLLWMTIGAVLLLGLSSCGGGSTSGGGGGGGATGGTPPGSYTVTVKASVGSMEQSLPLTLVVQ